jgi:hypothetical protein
LNKGVGNVRNRRVSQGNHRVSHDRRGFRRKDVRHGLLAEEGVHGSGDLGNDWRNEGLRRSRDGRRHGLRIHRHGVHRLGRNGGGMTWNEGRGRSVSRVTHTVTRAVADGRHRRSNAAKKGGLIMRIVRVGGRR